MLLFLFIFQLFITFIRLLYYNKRHTTRYHSSDMSVPSSSSSSVFYLLTILYSVIIVLLQGYRSITVLLFSSYHCITVTTVLTVIVASQGTTYQTLYIYYLSCCLSNVVTLGSLLNLDIVSPRTEQKISLFFAVF